MDIEFIRMISWIGKLGRKVFVQKVHEKNRGTHGYPQIFFQKKLLKLSVAS
jgi:hypothetical protein